MHMTDRGLLVLARHEGIVPGPYRDSTGTWTFGIGHTAAAGPPDPATMPRGMPADLDAGIREAFRLFRSDLARYEAAVLRAVTVPLEAHEFDALVSFHYNTGGIARAALTRHLNAGNRVAAADAFLNWRNPASIIPRREAERDLFRHGRYLQSNIAGGEGFDWFYASQADREAQLRSPISDGAYGEDWIWRFKDLRSWWSEPHHDRPSGVLQGREPGWARPAVGFVPNGGASLDPEPGAWLEGRYADAVRVTDAAGNYLSAAKSPPFPTEAGTTDRLVCFYTAGNTQHVRVSIDHRGDGLQWIYILGAPGVLEVTQSGHHVVSNLVNEDLGGGVWRLACDITWGSSDAEAKLMVGPGWNDAGEYMVGTSKNCRDDAAIVG